MLLGFDGDVIGIRFGLGLGLGVIKKDTGLSNHISVFFFFLLFIV